MSESTSGAPLLPTPSLPDPTAAAVQPTTGPDASMPAPSAPASPSTLTIDGDAPRLGNTTLTAPTVDTPAAPTLDTPTAPTVDTPAAPAAPTRLDLPSLPSLPSAAPVLTSPAGLPSPDDAPTTPAPAPTVDANDDDAIETSDEPVHPMAHLMPEKAAPSEASMKAAAIRAAKKKKAKKIKLGVAAGFLVVAVAAGPPLWSWLTNAINESGGVSTEAPAD